MAKERVSRKLLENQVKQLADKLGIPYVENFTGGKEPVGGVYLSYWGSGGGYQLEFITGKGGVDTLRYPGRRKASEFSDMLEFANNILSLYKGQS